MKNIIILLIVVCFAGGCSHGKSRVGLMIENPPKILRDPLYTDYNARVEELERLYLNQEISYAEYMKKKGVLEDQYSQEADRRKLIVEGN